jgi:hypothetical protein
MISISTLTLSISIGDRGGESLGEALAENKSVVVLNLEKNSLNQVGIISSARVRNDDLHVQLFSLTSFVGQKLKSFGSGWGFCHCSWPCTQHNPGEHQPYESDSLTMGRQMPR